MQTGDVAVNFLSFLIGHVNIVSYNLSTFLASISILWHCGHVWSHSCILSQFCGSCFLIHLILVACEPTLSLVYDPPLYFYMFKHMLRWECQKAARKVDRKRLVCYAIYYMLYGKFVGFPNWSTYKRNN